jgi:hypothetical protein
MLCLSKHGSDRVLSCGDWASGGGRKRWGALPGSRAPPNSSAAGGQACPQLLYKASAALQRPGGGAAPACPPAQQRTGAARRTHFRGVDALQAVSQVAQCVRRRVSAFLAALLLFPGRALPRREGGSPSDSRHCHREGQQPQRCRQDQGNPGPALHLLQRGPQRIQPRSRSPSHAHGWRVGLNGNTHLKSPHESLTKALNRGQGAEVVG